MITVGIIRNGATYLSQHLRKNDYWAEGERAVEGQWIGEAAAKLGLTGPVTDAPFQAVRENRHPDTGEPLTLRDHADRVAFFDLQLSAPKDVSVLALVGGDDRIRAAFEQAVQVTLREMERFAAVRERRGSAASTEAFRLTGNFAGAVFFHDASRDLDPQLHAHAVLANVTWDAMRSAWLALQPAEMLRASGYLRQVLYRELASRIRTLGYEPYGMHSKGFSIRGVEHLRERFSKRAAHVRQLAEVFAAEKGRAATAREIEVLVRESRDAKLTAISTPQVRARQRAELTPKEVHELEQLIRGARELPTREQWSHGTAQTVLAAALRHVFERHSVIREGAVLGAALELYPDFYRWTELRDALAAHPDVLRHHGEMTLRLIRREEAAVVQRVITGRNQFFPLGEARALPAALTAGQRSAASALLASRDFLTVLIGDAGTGKTTLLRALAQAHVLAGGRPFLPLAPTTRARDALTGSGLGPAETVQRFLISESLQENLAGQLILVDEAGLLSTQQLDQLTRIAHAHRARLLLVGDTKQHYSVERGDGLRHVLAHSSTPWVQLSDIVRQRTPADRQFSRLLARGDVVEAFGFAERRGLIRELPDDALVFERAAEHYVRNRRAGIETLTVIPFWEEIERFTRALRPALRQAGLLGEAEVTRAAVQPLTWTAEQKVHWAQYQNGDQLLFTRDTRFFPRGSAAEVVAIAPDGLWVRGAQGRETKITRRQRRAFEVGRPQGLAISAGDRLLFRARDDAAGFANGDVVEVAAVHQFRHGLDGSGRVDQQLPRNDTGASEDVWSLRHGSTMPAPHGALATRLADVLGVTKWTHPG